MGYTKEDYEKLQKVFEDTNAIMVKAWDKIMEVYDRTQTIMTDAWSRIEAFLHEVNPILIQQSQAFYQLLIDAGIIIKPREYKISKKKIRKYMEYMNAKKENS